MDLIEKSGVPPGTFYKYKKILLTPLQYDGLFVAIIVGALAIISYAVGLFRWIWERLSGRQSHELQEHYSRMRDEVFEPLSKLPAKLPMNLRNASEVKVNCQWLCHHIVMRYYI